MRRAQDLPQGWRKVAHRNLLSDHDREQVFGALQRTCIRRPCLRDQRRRVGRMRIDRQPRLHSAKHFAGLLRRGVMRDDGFDGRRIGMVEAIANGISIAPGPMFTTTKRYRNCIRVGCGNLWSAKLEMGLMRLGKLAAELA